MALHGVAPSVVTNPRFILLLVSILAILLPDLTSAVPRFGSRSRSSSSRSSSFGSRSRSSSSRSSSFGSRSRSRSSSRRTGLSSSSYSPSSSSSFGTSATYGSGSSVFSSKVLQNSNPYGNIASRYNTWGSSSSSSSDPFKNMGSGSDDLFKNMGSTSSDAFKNMGGSVSSYNNAIHKQSIQPNIIPYNPLSSSSSSSSSSSNFQPSLRVSNGGYNTIEMPMAYASKPKDKKKKKKKKKKPLSKKIKKFGKKTVKRIGKTVAVGVGVSIGGSLANNHLGPNDRRTTTRRPTTTTTTMDPVFPNLGSYMRKWAFHMAYGHTNIAERMKDHPDPWEMSDKSKKALGQ